MEVLLLGPAAVGAARVLGDLRGLQQSCGDSALLCPPWRPSHSDFGLRPLGCKGPRSGDHKGAALAQV